MNTSDIILAVATAPGHSPRGIVRMSGRRSFDVLQELVADTRSPDPAHDPAGHDWRAGNAHFLRLALNQQSLPVMVITFPAPHSYTGEESVEIHTAGNPGLLERVIDAILDEASNRHFAARRAEAGEFTARAFFNDKLTLTQAEGVQATIAARSDAELRAAEYLTSGSLGRVAAVLADQLAAALALVEAGIDFTDQEDVIAIEPRVLADRLEGLHEEINHRLERSVGAEVLAAIPWVVLAGPPNVGKSTLFNALLGHPRAVISNRAGTTRDVLTEPLALPTRHGPAEVLLVDLAGLDDAPSAMNRKMQAAARDAMDRADLVIRCIGPNECPDGAPDPRELRVATKADCPPCSSKDVDIVTSGATGQGLNALRDAIAARLADRAICLAADMLALQPRHDAAMRSARGNLASAIAVIRPRATESALRDPELVAAAMRAALNDLAALAGDVTPDDVLGRIFASFCVGK